MRNININNGESPDQNARMTALLMEQNELLKQQFSNVEKLYTQSLHNNSELEKKYEGVLEQLEWFKRQMFGQKSERFISGSSENSTQDDLFGFAGEKEDKSADDTPEKPEGENSDNTPEKTEGKDGKPSNGKKRKKSSKLSFSDDVTVVREVLDIPDEDKICPETGEPLKCIGVDSKELLYCVPGKFIKLIIERPKYARPVETEQGQRTEVLQQKAEPELIRGTKFHNSFIAYLLTQKYVFHVPINRVIEELRYNGVTVSSQALSGLIINVGKKLKPLFELMMKELLKQNYLFTDDTGGKMLEKGHGKAKNTYIWAYIGGDPDKPRYIIYKHTEGRSYDNPREHLSGFKGTITADAFGGYERLENDAESGINWNACWCHARREWEKCLESSKYAREIMTMMQQIFMIERECWERGMSARRAIRKDIQTLHVEAIFEKLQWMSENLQLIPKTPLHKAVYYMLKRPAVFKRFLTDPNLRIENNTAEHAMRKFVIGRRNWMFFGSKRGADAGCTIMSFAQTCRAMDINPNEYFEDILNKLGTINQKDTKALKQLLPDRWLKNRKSSSK